MSSYIDVVHPERHAPYLDIPNDVVDYLHYLDFVKLRSPRTVNGYYLDLRGFFRYMMQRWQRVADDTPPARKSIGCPRTPRKTSASARRPGLCPNI